MRGDHLQALNQTVRSRRLHHHHHHQHLHHLCRHHPTPTTATFNKPENYPSLEESIVEHPSTGPNHQSPTAPHYHALPDNHNHTPNMQHSVSLSSTHVSANTIFDITQLHI